MPQIVIRHKPVPAYSTAFFSSPAPRCSEKLDAAPMPSSKEMAVQAMESGNAMLVAALPSMPTPWPMKIWSTMLYSEVTSIEMMQGTAKLTINLLSFSTRSGLTSSASGVLTPRVSIFSLIENSLHFCLLSTFSAIGPLGQALLMPRPDRTLILVYSQILQKATRKPPELFIGSSAGIFAACFSG